MSKDKRHKDKRSNIWRSLLRQVRQRLIGPILRHRGSPETVARGVMIGLFWAMLPLVGVQMALVVFTWVLCRNMLAWDFSLPQALAWTWVTNIFTIITTYYTYYLTGQLLNGQFGNISGYQTFLGWFKDQTEAGIGWWQGAKHWSAVFLSDLGWPILIGSLPWTVLAAVVGYYLTLNVVQDYRRRRAGSA